MDRTSQQYLLRTVLGEAARQGDDGMAAVAHVILNRAKSGNFGGNDVRSVVTAKHQFEPWNTPEGRKRMMSYKPGDPAFDRASRVVNGVIAGRISDPTGGATHFLNEAIVRHRRGGSLPKWANEMSPSAHRIGDHTFYGGSPVRGGGGSDTLAGGGSITFDPQAYEAFKAGKAGGAAPNAGGGQDAPPAAGGFDEQAYEAFKAQRNGGGQAAPAPTGDVSRTEAFGRGLLKGLTFNLSDEMYAKSRQPTVEQAYIIARQAMEQGKTREEAAQIAQRFREQGYEKFLAEVRAANAAAEEARPGYFTAGEITGAGVSVAAGGGAGLTLKASTKAGQYATGTALGSGAGAVAGFNDGEGGAADRLVSGAKGAAWGAAGGGAGVGLAQITSDLAKRYGPRIGQILGRPGAVREDGTLAPHAMANLRKAGIDPDEVTEEFQAAFVERSRTLPPDQAGRAATLDAAGAPATRGQITGDVIQQAEEEAARAGARGQGPARVMREFDDTQTGALAAERSRIGERLGNGDVIVGDALEAGENAFAGVQRKAASAKGQADEFYRVSDEAGISIAPEAFDSLRTRIDDGLARAQIIVDEATPHARRFLQILTSRATRPEAAEGGVPIKLVDVTRSRISTALRDARQRADTGEVEALSAILGEMDAWIDDAVEGALYSGAPEGLDALKAARGLWANYRKQFFGKKGADNFIRKMVEDEATPRDVVSWLYGNSRMGGNAQSVAFAKRLKTILGPDSAEWAALRQGAWARLTQAPRGATQPGAKKVSEDIFAFLRGDNRQLAMELFTREEIRYMAQYARALQTTTPQRRATNPSGSGYEVTRAGAAAFEWLSSALGFAGGGLEGGIAGRAGARAMSSGGGWLKAKAATAGIRPTLNVAPPGVAGGATAEHLVNG